MADRPYEFAAFISYNSADRATAQRIQHRLENYAIPKLLRGRATRFGVLGNRIGRVCRDRTDFRTGESLSTALREALDASSALVVLCSPASAASKWVNAEVEHFIATGRASRIFPVIVALAESGRMTDSFPPALLKSDGDEAIAADIRPEGDGWQDGVLKVLASIIDAPFDDLRQRALAAARARARLAYAIAGATTLSSLAAIAASVIAVNQRNLAVDNFEEAIRIAARSAEQTITLTDRTEVPRDIIHRFLIGRQEDLSGLFGVKSMEDHRDLKIAAAEAQLLFSDLYAEMGRSAEQLASALKAEAFLKEARAPQLRLDFSRYFLGAEAMDTEFRADQLAGVASMAIGRAYADRGDIETARLRFAECATHAGDFGSEWELDSEDGRALAELTLRCRGREASALAALSQPGVGLASIEAAIADFSDATGEDPTSADLMLDLARLLADSGRLADAEKTLDRLRQSIDAGGAADGRQRKIEKVKTLEMRSKVRALAGRIDAARADMLEADAVLQGVIGDDPADRRARLVAAEHCTEFGELESLAGDGAAARRHLARALEMLDALIAFDATRRDWLLARARARLLQSDLAFRRIEDFGGRAPRALAEDAIAAARAALADASAAATDRDFVALRLRTGAAVSLARALRVRGEMDEARSVFAKADAGLRAAGAAGGNFELLLALMADEAGDQAAGAGDHAAAAARYGEAIALYTAHLERDPAAALAIRDLVWTLMMKARVENQSGRSREAAETLRAACKKADVAPLGEYALFRRDAAALKAFARERGVRC
jgi:tetratricopeptide (TPR) repeat protein